MGFAQKFGTAAAAIFAIAAGAAVAGSKGAPETELAPLATPPGITQQPLGLAQGYSLSKPTATKLPRAQIVFATAEGMTLYTYDKDPLGKSTCLDACAQKWHPATAPKNAVVAAGWTTIPLADGSRQWALRGKPLYTFADDVDVGSVGGNSPKRFGRGPLIGLRGATSKSIPADKPLPEGWHAAMMYPVVGVDLPSGISIRDLEDAMALGLIDDRTEKTLYAFRGDARAAEKACDGVECRNQWVPLAAPRLALPKGDFAVAARDDGITQWTYRGHALFTYAGDLQFDDANGVGLDPRFELAAFARYYLPENMTIHVTHKLGKVLATPDGMTLYRRNSYIYQSGGGHGMRRGDTVRPAVGRDLNINAHCETDCDKWRPFLAPRNAVASGDFTLYDRPDGSKQWASRGYALWTYDGDKKPGDINGNDDYQLELPHNANTVLDIGTPYDGAWALFWIAAYP